MLSSDICFFLFGFWSFRFARNVSLRVSFAFTLRFSQICEILLLFMLFLSRRRNQRIKHEEEKAERWYKSRCVCYWCKSFPGTASPPRSTPPPSLLPPSTFSRGCRCLSSASHCLHLVSVPTEQHRSSPPPQPLSGRFWLSSNLLSVLFIYLF